MHEYKLIRSKRKTLSLCVKPNCTVEVRAPLRTSAKEIDRFVAVHEAWIEKNKQIATERNKQREAFCIDYGTEVCFFGKRIPIKAADIKKAELRDECVLLPRSLNKTEIKEALIKLYKQTAKDYIAERLPVFAEQIGVKPSRLTVTSAKTNWGSCTADRVHFSWHIIMAEKEVIDYVIIHELVHILHHNHSKSFWSEVEKHCPDWKTLRKKLKTYSEIIIKEDW